MTVLRAHFDGKVFVPDEPVSIRIGEFTLQVIEHDAETHALTALPVLRVPPGAKAITSDDVRRALDDDEGD